LINTLHSTFTGIIEIAINKVLPLDPDYQQKMKRLAGRVVAIFFTDLELQIYFIADTEQFTVLSSYEGIPDVKLSGKSWDFFHMGINNHNSRKTNFDSNIHFEGDVATGQNFAELFAELNIDWEEALADVTGDIFAHQATNFARQAGSWLKNILSNSQDNLSEYMQEEIRITPTKVEIENFFDDINILKDDADKLSEQFKRFQGL
jgi:ubiquinone biosynthesis protein UbiJ